jgi:pyruvate/oxaloacetate carboxyltransferase
MLRSRARDRRKVRGMYDLVVMPTLTHVDSVTLNVVRPGGMTSRMSSKLQAYNSGGEFFVTDWQACCLW